MRINPINYKVHGAALALGFLALSISAVEVNSTFNRMAEGREDDRSQRNRITEIERDYELSQKRLVERSDLARLAADRHVNVYNSVVVPDYVCQPDTLPQIDFSVFADGENTFNVADQNQMIIGQITPSGAFRFNGCNQ